MQSSTAERVPLLAPPLDYHDENVQCSEETNKPKELGPLDLSRSNRWAILCGIWMASFLSVRPLSPSNPIFLTIFPPSV